MKPTFHVYGVQTEDATRYAVARHLDGKVMYRVDSRGRRILSTATEATRVAVALGTEQPARQGDWAAGTGAPVPDVS